MAKIYSEEQLNKFDKDTIVQLFLMQQEQLAEIDHKLQLVLEQLTAANKYRYGRSSEKMESSGQLRFAEVDGEMVIVFNEVEALAEDTADELTEETIKKRGSKKKGKKASDIDGLPKEIIIHEMTDEELAETYPDEGWKRLPDEIYHRYSFTPAKIGIEEHHVAVYSGKKSENIKKAKHPAYLLRGSLVSPSIESSIIVGKYVNATPLARIEKLFEQYAIPVTRQNMANWTIRCAEEYLSLLYDLFKELLLKQHVIQADETPLLVNKDGRPAGSKSYMWVYRTGKYETARPIILYDYQRTRKSEHPREFLKNFNGICVTDGYQVYHSIEEEMADLEISGCWAHCRRRYDEAVKALPKSEQKLSLAYIALSQIQAIYHEESQLQELSAAQRRKVRIEKIKPLVEAYFSWVKKNIDKVMPKSKTHNGMTYSLNQEKYLRRFLDDGEIPIDNNTAEQSIRGFCIGKKNWVMCDTINGAEASAIIYSLVETAKANKLKIYEYFNYLLTEIPEHMEDTNRDFLYKLLPWSDDLPAECRK
jgi:transposase